MAIKTKPKQNREYRMNGAGVFAHPTEDYDVFSRLSSLRQAEVLETHEIMRKYPFAVPYRICDLKTRKPYPGQILVSEIRDALNKQKIALPEVPAGYKFDVPNGVPLSSFAYCYAAAPNEKQAYHILLLLEDHLTQERLIEACVSNGRLLSNKPLDGVYAFIWRLARYMSGIDPSLSSSSFVDLIDGVSKLSGLRVDPWQVKTIMKLLEQTAATLADNVGENRYAANTRWAKVTGLAN